MDYVIGIDIGTTGTKSALFNSNGNLLDSEYISYPVTYPFKNWAEQNPEDWWNALASTVKHIASRNKEINNVKAISLSTQGGCLILLDENFCPICNSVSWLDHRSQEISELLKENISEDELYKTSGWSNTNCLNLPTIFWFKEKRPDIFKKVRYFASTIDYINYLLTGIFSIDYSNLAMTMFLDLHKRDWSDRALQIAGITRNNVPQIIPSGKIIGALKKNAAEELSLPKDVILVSGAHDQYCASIGAGAVNSGDCVLSTGTAWVLTLTSDKLFFDENRIIHPCLHLFENKYGLLTSVPSGGNSLNWFQSTFQPELSYEELSLEAEKAGVGSKGLIFIPKDISGKGRGAFVNIDTVHNLRHFTRSVLEGVALSSRKHIEIFSDNGIKISKLIMIGGGAKSSIWPQIVADISNIPIIIPEQKEAACAGAAILAGAGCGIFTSVKEAAGRFLGKKVLIKPIKKNAEIYEKVYEDFVNYLEYL